MLSCKDITAQASDFHDKQMKGWQRLQFQLHLYMCKNCRRFMSQFETTLITLQMLDDNVPKPNNDAINVQVAQLINSQSPHKN